MLSNLVCRKLDADLWDFASEQGLAVTRYSDDITFSAAAGSLSRQGISPIIKRAREILACHHFASMRRKIAISTRGARKLVLGLLVDGERPRLTKEMRGRIADHVRGLDKFGITVHLRTPGIKGATDRPVAPD
jgi:RNA-directed DNA polymerase